VKIVKEYTELIHELRVVVENFFQSTDDESPKAALGFCGGRSIKPLFDGILKTNEYLSPEQWSQLQFFLVDERVVPAGSMEANFTQLESEFLQPLFDSGLIAKSQWHPLLRSELKKTELAADYQDRLRKNGKSFLAAFLGVGEDGHIASLFPGFVQEDKTETDFDFVDNSPKPPSERVTASAPLLQRSEHIFLIFSGSAKKEAWEMFNSPEVEVTTCPAKLFYGQRNVTCLVNVESD